MAELRNISESGERMMRCSNVSGWDDDADGVEDERNPEGILNDPFVILI